MLLPYGSLVMQRASIEKEEALKSPLNTGNLNYPRRAISSRVFVRTET